MNKDTLSQFASMNLENMSKLTKADGQKLWVHLKRFPHYDDLKELNDKFLPEL